MGEQNPLQITPTPPNGNRNLRGRPRKQQTTTFSSQPKSIVSQLIQQMVSQNNVILPIEGNSENNTQFAPIEECDQIYSDSIPKFKKNQPKMYACEFPNCDYSTKLSSNLLKHRRRHTGEKPYLCDRCSFRTNFSNSLKVHKRLHTVERPYQCSYCDYRCNSISNLKKHSRARHKVKGNALAIVDSTVVDIR